MLTKELDELIEELNSRIGPTLKHSPDPIAAEFLGAVLEALQEYREIRCRMSMYDHVVGRG